MKTPLNTLLCAATAVAALVGATSANAASIVNGNFEQCAPDCPINLTPLSATSGQLTGWAISSGNGGDANAAVEWVTYGGGSGWKAVSASYSIGLSGANEGTISQTIATVTGVTYDIGFDVSAKPSERHPTKNLGLELDGVTTVFSFVDKSTSLSNMRWVHEDYIFTATSDSTTLSLFNDHPILRFPRSARLYGVALDDVRIQTVAVPEPATWAMMILGMAGLGGAVRARRRYALAAWNQTAGLGGRGKG